MVTQPGELAGPASVSTTIFRVKNQIRVSPDDPNSGIKVGLSQAL